MNAFYGTADQVSAQSGGGHVTANELQALREVAGDVVVIGHQQMADSLSKLTDTPFLADYLMAYLAHKALDQGTLGLAHFYSGTCTQTIALLKARGIPVTYTSPAHNRALTIEEYTRMGINYPYPHIRDDALWAIFKRGLLDANLVVTPSRASAEFLASEGCQRLEVIPHGCIPPATIPPLPPDLQVGYLGQTGPDKGLVYLIGAWGKLNWPTPPLSLAGSGTERLGPMVGRVTNGGRFQLLGWTANPAKFYASISVYVQPSVSEAFGIPALEAMAHGRPVVCSEGAGVSELVTEGIDGFVVPRRSQEAIAERLAWFRANPHRIDPMGQRAREKALKYTWPIIRERYKVLWRTLL